jgi:hypothetical protein
VLLSLDFKGKVKRSCKPEYLPITDAVLDEKILTSFRGKFNK